MLNFNSGRMLSEKGKKTDERRNYVESRGEVVGQGFP